MERTRIYLVRHGQVEGHEEKRYNGQKDVALTPRGRMQLDAVAKRLADHSLDVVYGSDLQRCRYGAEVIAEAHGFEPRFAPQLRELHIGAWEGRTWQELQSRYPVEWQARLYDLVNYRVPDGETLLEMAQRVRRTLTRIIAEHRGGDVVVVAHGGVNRVVLLDAIGAPLERMFHIEQDYGCLNIIDYFTDGYMTVRLLNG